MSIPASKCGLVIGRGGEVIKQINAESGAHVELSREANKDPLEKTFVIRGSDIQVEHAKHLICIKVGDIPPNTPFVRPGAHPQQMHHPHMQQPHPMQQMQGHPHVQQHHQMQSQHPMQSQNTMTNVQMWTGKLFSQSFKLLSDFEIVVILIQENSVLNKTCIYITQIISIYRSTNYPTATT